MLTRFALCFALFFLVTAPDIAVADVLGPHLPKRESLVAFWEARLKADTHVQLLEKAKEEGVYNFQTDFFPYKGRLKLLNAAVSDYDTQYYQNLYRGIVEIELLDADEAFFKKYARSYGAWVQDLNYYYNWRKGVWFTTKEWDANAADFDKYAASTAAAATNSAASCSPTANFWNRYGSSIISIGVFGLIIVLLLAFARKQNKRVWDNHAKALEEQQRGLSMVEASQKIAEESLKHQLEHTKLLQDIAAALRK